MVRSGCRKRGRIHKEESCMLTQEQQKIRANLQATIAANEGELIHILNDANITICEGQALDMELEEKQGSPLIRA